MAVNIHITIIELNALHTKRQNLFQELDRKSGSAGMPRSEERFSRNAETDLVCRLLLEKKNTKGIAMATQQQKPAADRSPIKDSYGMSRTDRSSRGRLPPWSRTTVPARTQTAP